ncbi:MAG: DUF1598 domain-containing protein [Pirellulaceae bacterium]
MISGTKPVSYVTRCALALLGCCVVVAPSSTAFAQFGNFFGNQNGVVGGVSIDAQGTLRTATARERSGLLKELRNSVRAPSGAVNEPADLRMISLTKLQTAVEAAVASGQPLTEEVRYLAGLQRIEYIFVYPNSKDIVLAGPAEGWVVRDDASVVGETTGRPVIQLEDLLIALRNTGETQKSPMSVSIDPTPEGEVRLQQLLGSLNGRNFNPSQAEPMMKKAMGPQVVSLSTVPTDSRMASTLVAADYQMKRYAMGLDQSPVKGMPSYLQMIRNSGASKTQPRWWMACDYEAILHSADRTAWQLTGLGIKAMTEDELVAASGQRTQTGKANKAAQTWADSFTRNFDVLASQDAVMGDLRNVMDLNVVATIIDAHKLEAAAGCDLGLLRNGVQTPSYRTAKAIDPQCSFVRGTAGWTVTASGGVEINPWKMVSTKAKPSKELEAVREQASAGDVTWWWN